MLKEIINKYTNIFEKNAINVLLEKPNSRRTGNILFEKKVENIEEAVKAFGDIRDENCWGASDYMHFGSGLVFIGITPIARISYNQRVWDIVDKDLYEWESHEEILPENFNDFSEKMLKKLK